MQYEEAMRKALACLKLAERGGTPAESAAAAAKAQEIIDRYGLDVSSADYDAQDAAKDKEEIKDFRDDPMDVTNKLDGWWAMKLNSYICRLNGCRPYIHNLGDAGRRLYVIGRPSDVQTVRYLYSYLKNEVKRLQSLNCKGNSSTYRYQYGLGVVDTIATKLHEQHQVTQAAVKQEHASNSMALVKVNNAIAKIEARSAAVDKWVEDNMDLRKGRSSGNTGVGGLGARFAGQRDGQSIRIGQASGALGSGRKALQ